MTCASLTAFAGTYKLTDGTTITGEPLSETDNGVIFRGSDGNDSPRIVWDNLTQDAIRQLLAEAKTEREKEMIAPLIEELPQEKAQRSEITVNPIVPPPRPTKGLGLLAVFGSPVGIFIFLVLYGANLYAAYEVARYRHQPLGMVCGLAAIPFLGILSPIIFISMPTRTVFVDNQGNAIEHEEAQTRFKATPPPPAGAPPEPVADPAQAEHYAQPEHVAEQPAAAPVLPDPIVFKRGDFSFNRRFFETKFAAFARPVPSEADKDMVLFIKSSRGDYVAKRISKITQGELFLQVFHDNASTEEMIPFGEVLEVQIRHKDLT
jgi:hypothetical protein